MAQIINQENALRVYGKQIMEQCEKEGRIPVILHGVGNTSLTVKTKKDLKGIQLTKHLFLPDDVLTEDFKHTCTTLANAPTRFIALIKKEHLSEMALGFWTEKLPDKEDKPKKKVQKKKVC